MVAAVDRIIRPGHVQRLSAGSLVRIPYTSVDENLDGVLLTALRYRVDNLTDSIVIADWTSVPAAIGTSSGQIVIAASVNQMSRMYRRRQLNKVTLEQTTAEGIVQIEKFYELSAVLTGATS